ncbi:GNAT family N-acetyltransferase [Acinetobacter lactucae]|uniref:GNAT family N-acetyltransferase n=1 Tax=Acinetobacter lactucae TaxID=1785128 RepID=A0AB35K2L4_9GAMM|nr:GNAT family N-acetyltransferase [Acinetobacter lactucae]MDD9321925.1 GNAT family N-acetyltransferase [Acinetobacter lactucae]
MQVSNFTATRDDHYTVSTDASKLDIKVIHSFLYHSKWAKGIDLETMQTAIQNSLCFGLYDPNNQQIGLARIITDYATFAYVKDVFIINEFQKLGLGRWLMECCLEHLESLKLRRIMLLTSTASWLYEKIGFTPLNQENFVWQILPNNKEIFSN